MKKVQLEILINKFFNQMKNEEDLNLNSLRFSNQKTYYTIFPWQGGFQVQYGKYEGHLSDYHWYESIEKFLKDAGSHFSKFKFSFTNPCDPHKETVLS